jgi:hypothetical protein
MTNYQHDRRRNHVSETPAKDNSMTLVGSGMPTPRNSNDWIPWLDDMA